MPGLSIYSSYLEYTIYGGYRRVAIVLTENLTLCMLLNSTSDFVSNFRCTNASSLHLSNAANINLKFL